MVRSYHVFRNDSGNPNIHAQDGKGGFVLIGIADCAKPSGPVDARAIAGLGKNYHTALEFRQACDEAGYLVKESEGTSGDLSDEQAATFPAVDKPAKKKKSPDANE